MNTTYLKIANLTYQVPLALDSVGNYQPFVISKEEVGEVTSTVSIGNIKVTDKTLCHHGLVIDDQTDLSIYKVNGDSYYATLNVKGTSDVYELYANSAWNHVVFSSNCISAACPLSVIDILMMLVFIYSSAYYGTILLHASCVKYGENALAFIGQSGAGKSTHSRLWLNYLPGCKLLNDDQPALRILEDGDVMIYGTPWSGKTPCYKNDQGHLKGIIRMKQAPFNAITPLHPIALFQELLSSSSMIKGDPTTFKQITSTLASLSSRIPGFMLENKPEKEAVKLVYTNTLSKCEKQQ